MRVLGIDYGARRIGIALGDTESHIATPWAVFEVNRLEALRRIREMAERENVVRIIVGVPRPLHNQSRETEQAKEIRRFIADLTAQGLSVEEQDETLTSKLAETQMRDRNPDGRRNDKRDDLAAAAILQSWLDRAEKMEAGA